MEDSRPQQGKVISGDYPPERLTEIRLNLLEWTLARSARPTLSYPSDVRIHFFDKLGTRLEASGERYRLTLTVNYRLFQERVSGLKRLASTNPVVAIDGEEMRVERSVMK